MVKLKKVQEKYLLVNFLFTPKHVFLICNT